MSTDRPAPRPGPRQTLSYLRELFDQHGIRPKSKLGQSFLIDLNLIDLILRTAELGRDDLTLEVGGGTGSLTVRLAQEAGAVLSVELDSFCANHFPAVAQQFRPGMSRDDKTNLLVASADPVDDIAEDHVTDRVGELEIEDDVGVGILVPAEFTLKRRLQQADHLTVDVIDYG